MASAWFLTSLRSPLRRIMTYYTAKVSSRPQPRPLAYNWSYQLIPIIVHCKSVVICEKFQHFALTSDGVGVKYVMDLTILLYLSVLKWIKKSTTMLTTSQLPLLIAFIWNLLTWVIILVVEIVANEAFVAFTDITDAFWGYTKELVMHRQRRISVFAILQKCWNILSASWRGTEESKKSHLLDVIHTRRWVE